MDRVLNPRTRRYITVGKKAYNDLITNEYTHDRQTNTLIPRQPPATDTSNQTTQVVLASSRRRYTDINVVPLKPTKYKNLSEKLLHL